MTAKLTQEEFIRKARKMHGDKYDYSKVVYKNWRAKIKIICKTHGEFLQIPNNHLRGNRCKKCVIGLHSGKTAYNFTGHEEIKGQYWWHVKHSAKIRNIEFKITIEDAWKLFVKQQKRCIYTNLPLKFGNPYKKEETTASLDRIDSSKGYTKDNIQWVHKVVNKMKMDHSEKEFMEWIELIYKTKQGKIK
jgi:hypothetical protein